LKAKAEEGTGDETLRNAEGRRIGQDLRLDQSYRRKRCNEKASEASDVMQRPRGISHEYGEGPGGRKEHRKLGPDEKAMTRAQA
jgi:hypothetical protein